MRTLLVFIRKEFFHVLRDRKTLLLLFGMPVAQIVLFGFALTNEIKNSKIVIVDDAHDIISRGIISKLEAGDTFIVSQSLPSHDDMLAAFRRGDIKLALLFPSGLAHDFYHGQSASVQVIADASDPNTATALTAYVNAVVQSYVMESAPTQPMPYTIKTETRMVYNPELKGATNFVPGVMALVLLLICVLMTSVSIVREKESGTMEVLLVSPFSPLMVIIAKAVPYLILSWVNLAVILSLSVFLLGVPVAGSLFLLLFVSTLFILSCLSLGLLISNVTASQQAAMMISLMGMLLPTLMFTGFLFPIENMPKILQLISNILPSKWFYIIVKSVMIKGLGWGAVWKQTLILLGMTGVLLLVSIRNFKIRLS